MLLSLSGCVVYGTQARMVSNDNGDTIKQVRPCLYFVACPPWSDPNDPKGFQNKTMAHVE